MDDFHCSFCGKRRREVRKLISGPRVFICDECVALCNEILSKEDTHERPKFPKPKEVMEELDRYVVGQSRAKKALSVAVYNRTPAKAAAWVQELGGAPHAAAATPREAVPPPLPALA